MPTITRGTALMRVLEVGIDGTDTEINQGLYGEPPPGANEILDCSPEASALGIRNGMPLRDARTVVPDLVVLPPDPIYYSQSFDRLLDAIEDAEPFVEPD